MVVEKVKFRIKRHTISFKNAFSGIFLALRTQPNFLVHVIATVVVLILAIILGLRAIEITVLVVAIVLVLVAEMINTAIEATTDLLSPKFSEAAKIAKDVSAGMVLTASIGAVILAILIFLPHIL